MKNDILVVAEHNKGSIVETTFELLGIGRKLADAQNGKLTTLLMGWNVQPLALQLGISDSIILAEHEKLAEYTPEAYERILSAVLREHHPEFVLIAATSKGLDISALSSARLGVPLVTSCIEINWKDSACYAISQLYAGKLMIETKVQSMSSILALLPGAYKAEKGKKENTVPLVTMEVESLLNNLKMSVERIVEPDASDIDITRSPVVVSIGRGIQNKDNVTMAEELATWLGGTVAASRPVVDQGWLPLTRQVGRSGMIVKPKLYFAAGISGAPEHVEGMRDAELIIACNTDPNAPIFNVAHYGAVVDVLELLPVLTEEVKKRSSHS